MVAKYTTIISKTKRLLKRFALNLIYNILREPAPRLSSFTYQVRLWPHHR